MTKHTPGPWTEPRIYRARDNEITRIAIYDSNGTTTVHSINSACLNRSTWNEALANAHLIAAAPELLEALQELSNLMEAVHSHDYTPDSFTTQPARTAIAKATSHDA
jgi:hypothetical protein